MPNIDDTGGRSPERARPGSLHDGDRLPFLLNLLGRHTPPLQEEDGFFLLLYYSTLIHAKNNRSGQHSSPLSTNFGNALEKEAFDALLEVPATDPWRLKFEAAYRSWRQTVLLSAIYSLCRDHDTRLGRINYIIRQVLAHADIAHIEAFDNIHRSLRGLGIPHVERMEVLGRARSHLVMNRGASLLIRGSDGRLRPDIRGLKDVLVKEIGLRERTNRELPAFDAREAERGLAPVEVAEQVEQLRWVRKALDEADRHFQAHADKGALAAVRRARERISFDRAAALGGLTRDAVRAGDERLRTFILRQPRSA